ncbi:uncharacterized protein [Diadema antillarum]|uniref:uncharacterized protein n=1 Tax=Diadema antillarum TaxID=105358 RepID=UPI003A8C0BE0
MLHPQLRAERGQYHTLMNELRENDKRKFKNYTRLSPEMFEELLIRLTLHLQKKDTHFGKATPPGLKLCVFLRHLATGATYAELGYNFRVGKETIQKFVPGVARAIAMDEYAAEVISLPTTSEGWLEVAGDFEVRWNLPRCLGALDGKHIRIQKPKNSGSLYFNYKQFFSVVLMALVDSKNQFVWIDVGGVGHQSDAQIYNNSELGWKVWSNILDRGSRSWSGASISLSQRHHAKIFILFVIFAACRGPGAQFELLGLGVLLLGLLKFVILPLATAFVAFWGHLL